MVGKYFRYIILYLLQVLALILKPKYFEKDGPYAEEANGCQNMECSTRSCCVKYT